MIGIGVGPEHTAAGWGVGLGDMVRAGYCAECAANVWLDDAGACTNGHPASAISGWYDVPQSPPPGPPTVRKEIPRWLSAIWGLVLVVLNVFMLVYVVSFAALFGSIGGNGAGPAWLDEMYFTEQGFGVMFAVVGFATVLSFAFMVLSAMHIFAWSGIAADRKLVWAAIVFAGAQPGMLAYWFMNVWHRERLAGPRRVPRDTPLRRAGVLLLGIVTVLPIAYFGFFFAVVGGVGSGATDSGVLDLIPALHMGVILLWFVLTAVYLVHVFRTPRLDGMTRAVWAAVVAFGGPIAWPVYWYLNMWRAAQDPLDAAPSGAR